MKRPCTDKNGPSKRNHSDCEAGKENIIPDNRVHSLRCDESLIDANEKPFSFPSISASPSPSLHMFKTVLLPEEFDEHMELLFKKESEMTQVQDYLFNKQTEITASDRQTVLDWLVGVCFELKLSNITLFYTKHYLDHYLSMHDIKLSELQLLGMTCLFVASKLEDVTPATMKDLLYMADNQFTRSQLLTLEIKLLRSLDYNLVPVTEKDFLRQLLLIEITNLPPNRHMELTRHLANYLLELSIMEYPLRAYKPSSIAAAAFSISLATFGSAPWSQRVHYYTRNQINLEEMVKVAQILNECVKQDRITNVNKLQRKEELGSIFLKYSTKKYLHISNWHCNNS